MRPPVRHSTSKTTRHARAHAKLFRKAKTARRGQRGRALPRFVRGVSDGGEWSDVIPVGQWASYRSAIEALRNAGIRFLLGGGFGLAVFTHRWRNTKDIDFYILPRDREAAIAALSAAGFVDYFDQKSYDPGWIYRSTRNGIIVDIIWSMANRRAEVDEEWFEYARSMTIREETVQVAPAEELLWCKLYIMQRDHCDWTDIFNLLYAAGSQLNWDRLVRRLGDDLPLLQAALTVYQWLCPGRAAELPAKLRKQLHLARHDGGVPDCSEERTKLLDSRGWFAAFQPNGKQLEV
jgi:hypothetical protein